MMQSLQGFNFGVAALYSLPGRAFAGADAEFITRLDLRALGFK
jgi:hypothetical protein